MSGIAPPPELVDALRRMGLDVPQGVRGEQLTGGVSSDIWRIDLDGGPVCVKRALGKLKVAADWRAPVGRNRFEAEWMRVAGEAVPGAVPRLLGQDEAAGALAMEFLPAEAYPLWKGLLRDGVADAGFAALVGARIGRIHAVTAADASVPRRFATDAIFYDIRLEPYLVATASRHPDLRDVLLGLVAATQANRRALVHGDVSPKNILVGPADGEAGGPVFLDAECAWWGDPAFDLAFCLNHLLLKCVWTPRARDGFLACFTALAGAYLAEVDWEAAAAVEGRAARLLPGLLLARVDGKSPVEYINLEAERALVRRVARALLADPVGRLSDVRAAWEEEIRR
jgi:aminoglycoside phosphotransferase (APT) family kinase protein